MDAVNILVLSKKNIERHRRASESIELKTINYHNIQPTHNTHFLDASICITKTLRFKSNFLSAPHKKTADLKTDFLTQTAAADVHKYRFASCKGVIYPTRTCL